MKHDVFGIGNALIDVLIHAEHEMIEDLGLTKGTFHLIDEEKLKRFEEKILHHDKKIMSGGSAANTLAGVAALGGSVLFFGKVGDDEHGAIYEEELKGHGVKSGIVKEKGVTGKAITIITPDSERTFLVYPGVSTNMKRHELLDDDIKQSKFLHIEAYQLEDSELRNISIEAMKIAKAHNVKVSLDLGDAELVKRNLKDIKEMVKNYIDVLFANEEEAKVFTGKEPEDALNEIAEMVEIAIVKIGKQGSMIKKGDNVHNIKPTPAEPIDTTGAGDIYASGILYGLSQGYSLDKAGNLGSALGAKLVEQTGARLDAEIMLEIKRKIEVN
ncbi:adenosine kinase [Candidatus Woesearchaeota archaeon]|nr:adenosine kinase [Candidatus Woesearchaeota archaeon]